MAREEQPPSYPGDHIFQIDGRGSFQIHHGADPKECMDVMSVVLPAENSFIVPPHYHPLSTEWMKLLEGRVEGVIGGVKTVMNAGDDWLEIPAGTTYVQISRAALSCGAKRDPVSAMICRTDGRDTHRHSFHKPGGKDGVKVVWLERCAPDASMKKRFFEDFIGSGEVRLLECPHLEEDCALLTRTVCVIGERFSQSNGLFLPGWRQLPSVTWWTVHESTCMAAR